MNRNNNHEYRVCVCVHACASFSGSLWFVLTWIWQAGAPLHPHLLFSRLLCITSACTALLLNVLHVDMFSTFDMFYMMFTAAAPVPLSFFFLTSFFLPWPSLAASGKQERWWKRAIVGKCSFLSGMTQAAAVISTVIVGHHQRASITPARPWHRQQVPALPARLAPTWLWKPSDIQKGTDLHWMHHWINTADYQLTYTVLYHTEKREKWVLKHRKPF